MNYAASQVSFPWKKARTMTIAFVLATYLCSMATADQAFSRMSAVDLPDRPLRRFPPTDINDVRTRPVYYQAFQPGRNNTNSQTNQRPNQQQTQRPANEEPAPDPPPPPPPPSRSREIGGPFLSTRTFSFFNQDIQGTTEFIVAGRMNVGEHNSPLPRDRSYFIYKNYNNLLNSEIQDYVYYNTLGESSRSVDQYLAGFEKTFADEQYSIELRMPFFGAGRTQFDDGFANNDVSIGNLGIIAKRLLFCDDRTKFSGGFGLTVPTGDDAVFNLADQAFTFHNDSAHLIPFLGMHRHSDDERWYCIAFSSIDIPMAPNQIELRDPTAGVFDLGELNDQTMLYLDFMLGRHLYENPGQDLLTGFSVQGEIHYAQTLDDAESVSGVRTINGANTGFNFGARRNRIGTAIAALVLHAELWNFTDLRVAALAPLGNADNRFFDSEFIVSLVQRY